MDSRVWLVLAVLLIMWTAACGESPDAANSGVETASENHSEASPPENVPPLFEKDVTGTSGRACVDVNRCLDDMGRAGAARSGGFVAGSFPAYVAQWKPNPRYGKIWWQPLHTNRMTGLRVEATLLDKPSISRSYRFSTAAYAEGAFYPSKVSLHRVGTWRLIATSGPDRGCFELTLPG